MTSINRKATLLLAGLLSLLSAPAIAFSAEAADSGPTCTSCHSADTNPGLHSIQSSPHGAGLAGSNSCISCHGDSDQHRAQPTLHKPEVVFKGEHRSEPELQNQTCLGCHRGGDHIGWQGSAHSDESLSCSSCHKSHAKADPVLDHRQQPAVCSNCHTAIKAQLNLPSRHPIKEGKTACSDCHNPHGSSSDASLVGHSLNATCESCHAEKRGPFLFEHPPAVEDCSLCHKAHGSVNPSLLTTRGPLLCQQCHSAAFHPSQINDGSGLAGGSRNQNMLGKNCLNCHPQVHGSNHPSGGRLTR